MRNFLKNIFKKDKEVITTVIEEQELLTKHLIEIGTLPTGITITSNGVNSAGPVVLQSINLLPIKGNEKIMNKDREILKKQIKEAVNYDFLGKEDVLEQMLDVICGKNKPVVEKNDLIANKLFKLKYKIKYFFRDIFYSDCEARRIRELAFNLKGGQRRYNPK